MLELGCGLALPSVVAARAGADVLVAQGMEAGGHQAAFTDAVEHHEELGLLALLQLLSSAVDVPVVASGGAGNPEDMVAAITQGRADAVLAASIFHRGTYSIASVKRALVDAGVPVRRTVGVDDAAA